jgi:hypothetical protein
MRRQPKIRTVRIKAPKSRLRVVDESGRIVDLPYRDAASLLNLGGRAAMRTAGELLAEEKTRQGKL